jgi:hypothetical protein
MTPYLRPSKKVGPLRLEIISSSPANGGGWSVAVDGRDTCDRTACFDRTRARTVDIGGSYTSDTAVFISGCSYSEAIEAARRVCAMRSITARFEVLNEVLF